jgi:hypothetical protein
MFLELGLPCLNLTDGVRLVDLPAYPLFKPGDDHYNERGHQWMGREAARLYLESGPRPEAPSKP